MHFDELKSAVVFQDIKSFPEKMNGWTRCKCSGFTFVFPLVIHPCKEIIKGMDMDRIRMGMYGSRIEYSAECDIAT